LRFGGAGQIAVGAGTARLVDLPVVPPVAPMLARLVRELPPDGYLYEPKWDGFRCLVFRDGDQVDLRSRNDRPLSRYFPEVVAALRSLPEGRVVLDGELLTEAGFSALMARLHPSASRVALLSQQTPATYIAFDLLACADRDLRQLPFSTRRALLERVIRSGGVVQVTPATGDADTARTWLEGLPEGRADGVIAKAPTLTYQPGRRAMLKVKRQRTADCVVAGLRFFEAEPVLSSILLGLYDDAGVLHHIGVVTQFTRTQRAEVLARLTPLATSLVDHPWEQGFGLAGGALGRLKGTAGRWTPDMTQDWLPVRPELVCEVSYDHVEGLRFRHPARFLRWRPDRDPSSCTTEQLS
jgi:ATP-dependent DNA ligase